MGYPLITITKDHNQSEKGLVTQEHFLVDVDNRTASSPFKQVCLILYLIQ